MFAYLKLPSQTLTTHLSFHILRPLYALDVFLKGLRCGEDVPLPSPQQQWVPLSFVVTSHPSPLKRNQDPRSPSPGWWEREPEPLPPTVVFLFCSLYAVTCYHDLLRGSKSSVVVDQVSYTIWSVNPGVERCIQHGTQMYSFGETLKFPNFSMLWLATLPC